MLGTSVAADRGAWTNSTGGSGLIPGGGRRASPNSSRGGASSSPACSPAAALTHTPWDRRGGKIIPNQKKNAPRLAAIMARLNRFADPQHIGLGWGIQLISQHGLLSFSAGAFVFWSPL